MAEKRVDPDDGKAYTFEELTEFYKKTYKKKEITEFWETLKPAKTKGASKGSSKGASKGAAKGAEKGKTAAAPVEEDASKPAKRRLKIGDPIPDVSLGSGFPPTKISLVEFCKGKKVVLIGLPGAFTPTWSTKSVPGYLAKQDELKAKGVTDVVVYCVNDGAVMQAWEEDLGTKGSFISIFADPTAEATKGLGLVMNDKGPMKVLGGIRCKRFSMVIDDGIIKAINVAASKADPTGDDKPEPSLVEKMLETLDKLAEKKEPKPPKVKVGDPIPSVEMGKGFPPEPFNIAEFCKDKKVVLVGLPGAFTPTWSVKQVPGYLAKQAELKAKGVTDVVVYSVNDGAVTLAWGKKLGIEGSMITFVSDTRSLLTRALGVVMNAPGPMQVLGNPRCKRFSMFIDNGVIKVINIAATLDDPTGDDDPSVSLVEKMLEDL